MTCTLLESIFVARVGLSETRSTLRDNRTHAPYFYVPQLDARNRIDLLVSARRYLLLSVASNKLPLPLILQLWHLEVACRLQGIVESQSKPTNEHHSSRIGFTIRISHQLASEIF